MERRTALINLLNKNKEKIINAGKYDEKELDELIDSLFLAETERNLILKKIEELGTLDIEKLRKELNLSEKTLLYNIEYLKACGCLEFIGETPRFFQETIDIFKENEIFPNALIIREKKLCCGCGLCVSVCPVDAIRYDKGTFEIDDDICIDCGLCYACCPRTFFPIAMKRSQEDVSNIKFIEQLNYYQEIYTAQTTDDRIKEVAQDGGIVTTLLKMAFQQNLIDGALAVGLGDKPLEPRSLMIKNEEELLKTAGTKYTNSPMLQILHEYRNYKRLAVVGTPCIMEALKKLTFYPNNKPFYDNIVLKIGLFCMESFDYADIIGILKNEFKHPPEDIKKMDINKGKLIIYDKTGSMFDVPIKRIKKYARFGCFFCDDLTSEQADISIGSIGSEPGWSTVIIRTERGAKFFHKAIESQLIIKNKIEEGSESFKTISRIAKSKLKMYKTLHRPKMIEQKPTIRATNFEEVPTGLTPEMAILETQRCLQCGNPQCVIGCPVNIRIPQFIKLLKEERFIDAIHEIKTYNLLPAICGRVCPQEIQCEKHCLLNDLGEPIAIGYLERFIADWERNNKLKECPDCKAPNGIKVAIIGSGPAGLTCAGALAMEGYDVTIFEAFHAGGGVLTYGIPEFRLPKEIVKEEIETLKMLNVKIQYNAIIGKTLEIEDLKQLGFKAFFIGVGAGLPMFMNIPGLNLNGVLTANEFLTRANLMKAYKFPDYDTPINVGKIVTVIGGGNVALDSARTALRLGAERVIIVYRRSEVEMPARKEEYHHAKEEGIEFKFLTNPVRLLGNENSDVKFMEVIKMELGEPDQSGRRSPIPIKNSEYLIETDTVIVAIGTRANPVLTKSMPELKLNKWNYIEIDENGQTNLEGVFAGGDIVTGSATVISAMGAGKKAAQVIDEYLKNKYL